MTKRTLPRFPATRGECVAGPRPCPHVTCRHHLFLEVYKDNSVRAIWPEKTVDELAHTCSLDVADEGGLSLDATGELLGITRERVRQIEFAALARIRRHPDYREVFGLGARFEPDALGSRFDLQISDIDDE